MLLDQLSTILTQFITLYLPFDDLSMKITCSVAITSIIYTILNFLYTKGVDYFNKKMKIKDTYVIIEKNSKLYGQFIKYIYKKYFNETKGCKVNNDDGLFTMIVDELNNGELIDTFNGETISISFYDNNSKKNDQNEKTNLSGKDIIIKNKNNMDILDNYIKSIIKEINTTNSKDISMYKLKVNSAKKQVSIHWSKHNFLTNKTMVNTIVTDEVKKLYYDDITKFINNKENYIKKGIPFKRGYILHGLPGCGKTSLIKAVAHDFNLPIFMLDLSILKNNNQLLTAMSELQYYINNDKPYLLILEDLDRSNLFKKNKSDDDSITEDCILNILDGIDECHGRIVIITTNDLEKLKKFKALIRPGRIDITVELSYCTIDQIERIIKFYYENVIEDDLSKLNKNIIVTPAQLIQIIYLINDVKKTIHFLNKFINLTNINIEDNIFNINWEKINELPKNNNNNDSLQNIIKNKTKRLPNRNKLKLIYLTKHINKQLLNIKKEEIKINEANDIRNLQLEKKKINLKITQIKKENHLNIMQTQKKKINMEKPKLNTIIEIEEINNNINDNMDTVDELLDNPYIDPDYYENMEITYN